MHYYKFNIADYRKDTTHLSPIEHYIYRSLIDWYYLDEKPIPKETQSVIRRLCLGSDMVNLLENVLADFFKYTENGYVHKRIENEIIEYNDNAVKNKQNGKKGGRPAKPYTEPVKTQSVTDGNPNESQINPNHKPLTINQEPLTISLGEICKKIIEVGINPLTINQANPTFITLVEAGATIGEFEFAAMEAKRKNQGFNYVLGIVKGERERAKNLDIHKGSMPEKQNSKDADRKSVTQAAFGNLLNRYANIEKEVI